MTGPAAPVPGASAAPGAGFSASRPPKLILLDLDGTLLGAGGVVSARSRVVLQRAAEAGSRIVIATGRPARILDPVRTGIPSSLALCYNGAVVLDLDTFTVVASRLIDGPAFRATIESLRAEGLRFAVGVEGLPEVGVRAEPDFREGADIPRGSLDELSRVGIAKGLLRVEADDFAATWDALIHRHAGTVTATRSGIDGLIELSAAGVSKGTVIAELAATWQIDSTEAIAFGDMPNDVDMLNWAGWSVAMGNAEPDVKSLASEVTGHHDDDGVAQVLERLFPLM